MVTRPRVPARTMAIVLVLLAAACGGPGASGGPAAGDIPDNQVFVAYTPPAGGFTVKVPEGWARTEVGGVVTFTDKFNSVAVQMVEAAVAPTVQSVERGELPGLSALSARVTMVRRASGDVLLVTDQADGPADPVTAKVPHLDVERYGFWRDGRLVVLTLSGAAGADNVDPWRTVSDSFRWS